MKVILLADVPRVGNEGDVVEVRDGYARNYLIPRGLAVRATKGALKELELRREQIERRAEEKRRAAMEAAERIKEQPVYIRVMAGERGRLHGRVTTAQIADALKEQLGISVDRRDIELREPIKTLGDYVITVTLYRGVSVDLTLRVVQEGEEAEEAEEAAEAEAEAAEVAEAEEAAEAAEAGGEEAEEAEGQAEEGGEGEAEGE